MTILKYGLVAVVAVVAMAGCTKRVVVVDRPAQRPGWTLLGERTVDGSYDHDAIEVGAGEGRWNRLMFAVEHHAVEIFDVRVHFGDGSSFDIPTRLAFEPNTRSRVVDLPGSDRVIRGGGWYFRGNICRAALRGSGSGRGDGLGFRVAGVPSGSGAK